MAHCQNGVLTSVPPILAMKYEGLPSGSATAFSICRRWSETTGGSGRNHEVVPACGSPVEVAQGVEEGVGDETDHLPGPDSMSSENRTFEAPSRICTSSIFQPVFPTLVSEPKRQRKRTLWPEKSARLTVVCR